MYFIYRFYFNELQFITSAEDSFDIDEEYEVAVSIDAGSPVSFWRFKLDRIGLAYRAGNEDLSAVRLVFRFPF